MFFEEINAVTKNDKIQFNRIYALSDSCYHANFSLIREGNDQNNASHTKQMQVFNAPALVSRLKHFFFNVSFS